MRRSIAIALLAGGLFVLAGCCPLARPARTFLDTVGVEYLDYVDADEALTADDKRIRRQHVGSFARAVLEAEQP